MPTTPVLSFRSVRRTLIAAADVAALAIPAAAAPSASAWYQPADGQPHAHTSGPTGCSFDLAYGKYIFTAFSKVRFHANDPDCRGLAIYNDPYFVNGNGGTKYYDAAAWYPDTSWSAVTAPYYDLVGTTVWLHRIGTTSRWGSQFTWLR